MKSWKYILTAALLPASLWAAGQFTGVVTSTTNFPNPSVKVYLFAGSLVNAPVDSTTTDATGTYSFASGDPKFTGSFYSLLATKAGYHSASVSNKQVAAGTGVNTNNLSTPKNDSSSTITGRVLHFSDSSAAIGATVVLSGGTIDGNRTKTTDSTGFYRFDSVGTGTGYKVEVTAAGYNGSSTSGIALGWNSTFNVPSFYLTRNLGTVAGVARRADSTSKVLIHAKMVFYINNLVVDSVLSDSNGNFSISLNAATYTMKSSLAGYKSNKGLPTRDTTVTVLFGQTTTSLVYLTPATGSIGATIYHAAAPSLGIPARGAINAAHVYLERRMGSGAGYNTWILTDSALTDASGFVLFQNLIPATGGNNPPPATGVAINTNPGGNYRVLVKAAGYVPNFDTTNIVGSVNPGTIVALAYATGSATTATVTDLAVVVPIYFPGIKAQGEARISVIGNRLVMDLGTTSNIARTVEVYDLKGSLQHSVSIPAGESRVTMPAAFAKGFLFQVK